MARCSRYEAFGAKADEHCLKHLSLMKKPSVVIATPCFGGLVAQAYMMSVIGMMTSFSSEIDISLLMVGHDALICRGRSTLVGKFLDLADATHLLFIDCDIAFSPAQFARLFNANKDFTAAMYPIKQFDWDRLAIRTQRGETLPTAGLNYVGTLCTGDALKLENHFATASYAGGGFQLIKRSVFEKMIQAYPELRYCSIHAATPNAPTPTHLYALFDPMIDNASGEYLSEDYAFCRRWRDLGGEIWVDLKSELTHIGACDFSGNLATRYGKPRPENPAFCESLEKAEIRA